MMLSQLSLDVCLYNMSLFNLGLIFLVYLVASHLYGHSTETICPTMIENNNLEDS
jgi:hypothetical protein